MTNLSTPALEVRDLRKTYKGGEHALKGVSFDVAAGDFFALLGPNGAGKSTTIGILFSLINKSSGRVRVNGLDIDDNFPLARTHLGLVPQETNFNQFKRAFEVLTTQAGFYGIPAATARRRAERYLKQLGLWEKRDSEVRSLSGGMKRRLMLARALVNEPRLLVLDEPTAGVDIEVRRMIWDFITKLNAEGTTIILTTHYLEEAENLCRNVAIIDHGRIVENSSMSALLGRLHRDEFLFYVDRPLTEAPRIASAEIHLHDRQVLGVCVEKDQDLNRVFAELDACGVRVLSMRNKSNRLERALLDLIGGDAGAR